LLIQWKDGKLQEAMIHSKLGGKCHVRYGSPFVVHVGSFAVKVKPVEPSVVQFDTQAGKSYVIRPAK